ncbi:hypothetical protein TNCV_824711 [Trichonephila clavipes]|nr:hypothetical protein TNCV_824711 [Trichonephila clavipes]
MALFGGAPDRFCYLLLWTSGHYSEHPPPEDWLRVTLCWDDILFLEAPALKELKLSRVHVLPYISSETTHRSSSWKTAQIAVTSFRKRQLILISSFEIIDMAALETPISLCRVSMLIDELYAKFKPIEEYENKITLSSDVERTIDSSIARDTLLRNHGIYTGRSTPSQRYAC